MTAVAAEPARTALPDYDAGQSAFHLTFRDDLYKAVDGLRLRPGQTVLDAPCGNGFYARRLADRVAPGGRVAVFDASPAYLELAVAATSAAPDGVRVEAVLGDVYRMPFADGSFDFVWCAQSLISLTDPVGVLTEFARVTNPGGRVAVLEADEFHHLLLPWPVELEIEVQRAAYKASRRRRAGPTPCRRPAGCGRPCWRPGGGRSRNRRSRPTGRPR